MEAVIPPHIIILTSPGMGHLIPLTEFAKRLVLHHNFTVTFTIPTESPPSKAMRSILHVLPSTIDHIFLPPANLNDLPDDTKIETRISLTVSRSLPSFRNSFNIIKSTHRVVALVVDLFGTDVFDVAKEFGVPPYIFFPSTAMGLSLSFYLSKLDKMYSCEYRDIPDPLDIPGCMPIHGRDLLDPTQDKKNDAYTWLLHHTKRYNLAEGILANSFMDLESGPLKVLMEKEFGNPPVYPVGPIVRRASDGYSADGSESLKWLDDQPPCSVLFVSFGSAGTLSYEQLIELAFGLEMSEQRFLWVARAPNRTFFNPHSTKDPQKFLPKGFMDRTKNSGLILPSWAPQIQILSHGSTGGFLTHCGWNSTLESVVHGIPLIAWPLFAEQKMNAVMLVDDLKVALRPKANKDGLIGRDEIARVVKGLMEGQEGNALRSRMRDLKIAAAGVLSEDGSSSKSLAEVANKWKNHKSIYAKM